MSASMNDGRWFAGWEPGFRADSIDAHRELIATEQGSLARKLIVHAVALIAEAFPTADMIWFYLTACPSDTASVQIVRVLDAGGDGLDIAPDFALAPQVIGQAEELLAEASDLGADFPLADGAGDRQRQLGVRGPLDWVRLPA